jgi:hypothetical protein
MTRLVDKFTPAQVVADVIHSYNETLSADPDLADAGIDGFMAWAWSDDEPLRMYGVDGETYRDCLIDAYNIIRA